MGKKQQLLFVYTKYQCGMTFYRQSIITAARNLGIYHTINNCYIKYLKAINLNVYVQNSVSYKKTLYSGLYNNYKI